MKVKVIDEVSGVSEDEAVSHLVEAKSTKFEGEGELTFYTDHYKKTDRDGYHPPKYLFVHDILKGLVTEELGSMDIAESWECGDLDIDNIEMETVHVFPKETKEVTRKQLKSRKMTRWLVPIHRPKKSESKKKTE